MKTTDTEKKEIIKVVQRWLSGDEGANLEFKKAENKFSADKDLPDYCAALANEGGGKLILGVEDKTRRVIGTKAFAGTHNTLYLKKQYVI